MSIDLNLLQRQWIHSHEESSDSRLVFRPAGYALPLSRGRSSLDLTSTSELSVKYPGPTDRTQESTGGWHVNGNTLTITAPIFAGEYAIDALDPDILVLTKREGKHGRAESK